MKIYTINYLFHFRQTKSAKPVFPNMFLIYVLGPEAYFLTRTEICVFLYNCDNKITINMIRGEIQGGQCKKWRTGAPFSPNCLGTLGFRVSYERGSLWWSHFLLWYNPQNVHTVLFPKSSKNPAVGNSFFAFGFKCFSCLLRRALLTFSLLVMLQDLFTLRFL